MLPQRRPRQESAAAVAFAEAGVATRGATRVGGARGVRGAAANTRRRLPGQRCSRPSRGSGSSPLLPPLAACSLAVLAFLGDPAASFQVRRRGCAWLVCVVWLYLGCSGAVSLGKAGLQSFSAIFDGWAADEMAVGVRGEVSLHMLN